MEKKRATRGQPVERELPQKAIHQPQKESGSSNHDFFRGELLPSWKLTYPTWGKGKSSSNMPYQGDMLIPWRVNFRGVYLEMIFKGCR